MAHTTVEAGSDVLGAATEQARAVVGEGARQVKDLLTEAHRQLTEQSAAQKEKAVAGMRSLAEELTSLGESSPTPTGVATGLVQEAAGRVGDVASWLDQREAGQLLNDARDFARRKPGTFILGALAAGVVAGRLSRALAAGPTASGTEGGSRPSSASNGPRHAATPAVEPGETLYSYPGAGGPAHAGGTLR